jgi:hypothetical protein
MFSFINDRSNGPSLLPISTTNASLADSFAKTVAWSAACWTNVADDDDA